MTSEDRKSEAPPSTHLSTALSMHEHIHTHTHTSQTSPPPPPPPPLSLSLLFPPPPANDQRVILSAEGDLCDYICASPVDVSLSATHQHTRLSSLIVNVDYCIPSCNYSLWVLTFDISADLHKIAKFNTRINFIN